MLARVDVPLPFSVALPEGENYTIQEYIQHGYAIRVLPPMVSDMPLSDDYPDQVSNEGVHAMQTNALRIIFQKEDFNRASGQFKEFDPSV